MMGLGALGTFDMTIEKSATIYYSWYIIDRISLIGLHKFLLALKRVQLMTSPEFSNINQIKAILKKQRKLEAFFLSINSIAIIIIVVDIILKEVCGIGSEAYWALNWVRAFFQLTVFCFNIYTFWYF